MKALKRDHKKLMVIEASYIYCHRHSLNYDTFFEEVYLSENFQEDEHDEFEAICIDLRNYGYIETYQMKNVTIEEYELCMDKYGSIELY